MAKKKREEDTSTWTFNVRCQHVRLFMHSCGKCFWFSMLWQTNDSFRFFSRSSLFVFLAIVAFSMREENTKTSVHRQCTAQHVKSFHLSSSDSFILPILPISLHLSVCYIFSYSSSIELLFLSQSNIEIHIWK